MERTHQDESHPTAPTSSGEDRDEERKPSDDLPAGAPDALKVAANTPEGQVPDMTVGQERGALDFVLGASKPVEFDVEVKYDTPAGEMPLTFHIRQLDGKALLRLEDEHRTGSGPFASTDDVALDAHIVSEATMWIEDTTGRKVDVKSDEFLGGVPTPYDAMRGRFMYAPGLLTGIAAQVRSVSGYAPDKVKSAERSLSEALGKS